MSHPTKTLKLTDHVIEEVFALMYTQSWFQIVDFDNWVVGVADEAEKALEWHEQNAAKQPRFFQSYDCKSADNAKEVAEYFYNVGVHKLEETYEGNEATNRFVYVYKTFI
ncbi:MAG: hypothetical protein H6581_15085 [Bacteroidia bacterium]|nr:hypothetical protein [Bacteroidia bacterium]